MIQASLRIVVPEEKRGEILGVLSCLKGPAEGSTACRPAGFSRTWRTRTSSPTS